MPVGDCQRAFGVAARHDGVTLQVGYVPGATNRGHLDLAPDARPASILRKIFDQLAGNEMELRQARGTPLQADWLAEDAHVVIEIDERQHFTSHRLISLKDYPPDAEVAVSVQECAIDATTFTAKRRASIVITVHSEAVSLPALHAREMLV